MGLGFFSESSSNVVSSLIIVNKGKKGKKKKGIKEKLRISERKERNKTTSCY